jgi:hypothetical protein
MLYQASVLNLFSNQFALYSNAQNVGAFEEMVNATMPSNASNCSAWLNALYLSADADGIAMEIANGTIAISTATLPRAYAVVRLNA